ncbi:MAG: Gmad2 immunoglobulin-like domain-containing protein [Alphaproteobacteria bacterium]|nr:Gmad2 immunoglobulin-like domain-containing protein [Alphaproteobacteria bacterium]MCB9791252.1 Gmad2 immunoglobulin-like domain-containing protein [Alphaproteobacteria bacterium]
MWLLLLFACSSPPAPPEAPSGTPIEAPSAPPAPRPARPGAVNDAEQWPIFVQEPLPGVILASGPIEVRGRAQVWEGRLSVQLLAPGGEVLDEQHVSATVAAPARGDWAATLEPPKGFVGPATVQAFSSSAKDGAPENLYKVPVVLR